MPTGCELGATQPTPVLGPEILVPGASVLLFWGTSLFAEIGALLPPCIERLLRPPLPVPFGPPIAPFWTVPEQGTGGAVAPAVVVAGVCWTGGTADPATEEAELGGNVPPAGGWVVIP